MELPYGPLKKDFSDELRAKNGLEEFENCEQKKDGRL